MTTIVDATMCTKVSHLALACGIGSSRNIPRLKKWKCAKGTCEECGVKILNLGECTYFTTNNDEIEVLEWIEAERQGKKDGTQNTQLELGRVKLPVCEVVSRLITSLEVNRLHVTESRWRDLMLRIDLTMSNPNKHRVICTDFGATLDLGSSEKGNCSVDNHSVMCIIFVVSEWREVEYINIEGNLDKTIISNCDKWVFLVTQ